MTFAECAPHQRRGQEDSASGFEDTLRGIAMGDRILTPRFYNPKIYGIKAYGVSKYQSVKALCARKSVKC